jgi:hypothetical protein
VGGAANRHVGPLTLPSPRPAGGEGKKRHLPKLSLAKDVERQEGADDEVRHVDQLA